MAFSRYTFQLHNSVLLSESHRRIPREDQDREQQGSAASWASRLRSTRRRKPGIRGRTVTTRRRRCVTSGGVGYVRETGEGWSHRRNLRNLSRGGQCWRGNDTDYQSSAAAAASARRSLSLPGWRPASRCLPPWRAAPAKPVEPVPCPVLGQCEPLQSHHRPDPDPDSVGVFRPRDSTNPGRSLDVRFGYFSRFGNGEIGFLPSRVSIVWQMALLGRLGSAVAPWFVDAACACGDENERAREGWERTRKGKGSGSKGLKRNDRRGVRDDEATARGT